VVVTYRDGTSDRLALENPSTWWPIEQDYFIDDFQFRRPGPLPMRVDLKTGRVRVLDPRLFEGKEKDTGRRRHCPQPLVAAAKELRSLTVRTLANDVVVGLMSATLQRP